MERTFDVTDWPIQDVLPYDNNPRSISDEAVDKVAMSLEQFGFQQPIVVDGTGVIIVGHTRWRAAQKLGYTEVPVKVASDLSDEQAQMYRITDNKSGEYSQWDYGLLTTELKALEEQGFDLEVAAFDPDILDNLMDSGTGENTTYNAVDDGSGGDHVDISSESSDESTTGVTGPTFNFDGIKVPMTDQEAADLKDTLTMYSESHGAYFGFVRWLLARAGENA